MRLSIMLRNENDQEGNTWFSDNNSGEGDIQFHMPHSLYEALGSPQFLHVSIDPRSSDETH